MNDNFNNPGHVRWSLTRVSDTIAARNSWTMSNYNWLMSNEIFFNSGKVRHDVQTKFKIPKTTTLQINRIYLNQRCDSTFPISEM